MIASERCSGVDLMPKG